MNIRDWALITFTVLAQMSVGSFLVLGVVHWYAVRKEGMENADRLSDRALLAIVPALILGLIASLFHLGNPLNAYKAVTNLGSSWLSREVLLGVSFTVLGTAFAFMQWRKISSFSVRNVIAVIAGLVGVAFVFSMSNVYMLPTQPAWNTIATPIMFFTTTLLLGSLAIGAALVATYAVVKRKEPDCADVQCSLMREALRGIAIASVILLGIELAVVALRMAFLASGSEAAVASVSKLIDPYGLMFAVQLLLVFVGAGLFGVFVIESTRDPDQEKVLRNLAYSAFILVLVAEFLGRFLFYAAQVQITV